MSSMRLHALPIIGFMFLALLEFGFGQGTAPSPAEGPTNDGRQLSWFFHFFISGYLNVLCTELCLGLIGIILMLLNVGFCCRQDYWSRNCIRPSHAGPCNHISLPLMYFLLDQFNVFKFFMYSLLIFLWRNCSDCFIYSSPCSICCAAWALIREDNFGEIWFASLEFIDCFNSSQKFSSFFTLTISLN